MSFVEFMAGLAAYDRIGAGNDDLQKLLMKKKEKEVLDYIKSFHTAAVSCVGGSGRYAGSWQTYVGHGRKDRRLIRAATLDRLLEALAGFYGLKEEKEEKLKKKKKPETLESYFPHWLEWKGKRNGNKELTLHHNEVDFDVMVKGTPLAKIPLKNLTPENLDAWARDLLISRPMSAKRFNTYKIVVTGPLELAAREGIIPESPWKPALMDYRLLYRAPRKAPSRDKIFYDDEIREIVSRCLNDYEKDGNPANVAIVINFDLGLRVGELSALRWEDIDWRRKVVNIRRQESEGAVEEYVKSDSAAGYRELPLSDGVLDLLRELRRKTGAIGGGYVFTGTDGSRKTVAAIANRFVYVQRGKDYGKPAKRIHCQRRTVATRIAKDRGLEAARAWLGHTDIQTTLRYIYTMETAESLRAYSNESSALNLLQQPGDVVSLPG